VFSRGFSCHARLDRITEVHGRRHLLRSCALEVYFTDAHEVFIAFDSPKERMSFYTKLTKQYTPLLVTAKSLKPHEVLKDSKYTELWRRRQISNFEYLMRLNIIAGRSYNDINQYVEASVVRWRATL
jgi:neurobeachin-like protein 1/2